VITLTDSVAATHSVKMIDETLAWSDAGLEVQTVSSVLLTAVAYCNTEYYAKYNSEVNQW